MTGDRKLVRFGIDVVQVRFGLLGCVEVPADILIAAVPSGVFIVDSLMVVLYLFLVVLFNAHSPRKK